MTLLCNLELRVMDLQAFKLTAADAGRLAFAAGGFALVLSFAFRMAFSECQSLTWNRDGIIVRWKKGSLFALVEVSNASITTENIQEMLSNEFSNYCRTFVDKGVSYAVSRLQISEKEATALIEEAKYVLGHLMFVRVGTIKSVVDSMNDSCNTLMEASSSIKSSTDEIKDQNQKIISELSSIKAQLMKLLQQQSSVPSRANSVGSQYRPGQTLLVGEAWDPHRTMMYTNDQDLLSNGWAVRFSFREVHGADLNDGNFMVFHVGEADKPHRMMLFEDQEHAAKHGWVYRTSFTVSRIARPGLVPVAMGTHQSPHRCMLSINCEDQTKDGWSHQTKFYVYENNV